MIPTNPKIARVAKWLALLVLPIAVTTVGLSKSDPVQAVIEPIYTLPFYDINSNPTCAFHCYYDPNVGWHVGTDYQLGIAGSGGELVNAAAGGVAKTCAFNSNAGNSIVVDHGNGHRTRYLHLSGYAVSDGQSVSRGQLIGYEGNTGYVLPAGSYVLHFETRHGATSFSCGFDGTAVDPYAGPYSPGTYLWTTNPPSYAEGESIGVASMASNRLDLFVRGNSGAMYHKWWDAAGWSGWENLGGCMKGGASAVSWGANRIDVVIRGCNDLLHWKYWNANGWSEWVPFPDSCLRSEPAVTSWGPNRLDVFVRGCNDILHWRSTTNGGANWSSWQILGGCVNAAPGAATWGGNHLAVFVRGCNNQLHRNFYFGGPWSDFVSLGGCLGSGPGADSWTVNRLDTLALGCNDIVHHNYSTNGGGSWSGFIPMTPGCLTSGTGVTSRTVNYLDTFARGCGARDLHQRIWTGSAWTQWTYLSSWP